MRFVRLSLVITLVLCGLPSSRAQDEYSKYLFNVGGGISVSLCFLRQSATQVLPLTFGIRW